MTVDVTPIVPAGRQLIEAYGGGGFQVSGLRYDGSIIVFPDRTLPWQASQIEALDETLLAPVIEQSEHIEVLLVGCGATAALRRRSRSPESRTSDTNSIHTPPTTSPPAPMAASIWSWAITPMWRAASNASATESFFGALEISCCWATEITGGC